MDKPLGQKAYGSIPHLPGSRLGESDRCVTEGMERMCLSKLKFPKRDEVVVQEKLDGSCCAVARLLDGSICPLGRRGYRAETSSFEMHHLFADWVYANLELFNFIDCGERVVGEWLAQAHGTKYKLSHGPFVAFDIIGKGYRLGYDKFVAKIQDALPIPHLIHRGVPISIEEVIEDIRISKHGAIDPTEGAVWRYHRDGEIIFLCKWVRPDKVDGCYLPQITGGLPIWNWHPDECVLP